MAIGRRSFLKGAGALGLLAMVPRTRLLELITASASSGAPGHFLDAHQLVEQLIEKALILADRVYALARGSIVLEAAGNEHDLPSRLERAYFGQDISSMAPPGTASGP